MQVQWMFDILAMLTFALGAGFFVGWQYKRPETMRAGKRLTVGMLSLLVTSFLLFLSDLHIADGAYVLAGETATFIGGVAALALGVLCLKTPSQVKRSA